MPALIVVWFALLFFSGSLSYQSSLLDSAAKSGQILDYGFHTLRAYKHILLDSWIDNLNVFRLDTMTFASGFLAATFAVVSFKWLDTRDKLAKPTRWLFVGIVIIFLGFALYLLTPHRASNDYVFMLSVIGGAIIVATVIEFVAMSLFHSRLLWFLWLGFLVFVGTTYYLRQHATFYDYSQRQAKIIYGVIEQVPSVEENTLLLIFDEAEMRDDNWMFGLPYGNAHFTDALRYVYQDGDLPVFLCYPEASDYSTPCALYPDAVFVSSVVMTENIFSYDRIIALTIREDDTVILHQDWPVDTVDVQTYNPHRLIHAAEQNSSILNGMLERLLGD
jgi:hypothetical protein